MSAEPGIGDRYQQETKYVRGGLPTRDMWTRAPDRYKEYESCLAVIDLPEPRKSGGERVWNVIAERRSVREYSKAPLTLGELSQILWATQGITACQAGYELRSAPSAGALYPIETYLVVNHVEGLEPGVYHYRVRTRQLEQLGKGDSRQRITEAMLGQEMAGEAAVVFIWTAVVQRTKWKYGQRGYRYMYFDAGHIGAHLSLATVGLGMASCQIGALFDDEVNEILGVDGKEETVLYASAVGRP